MTWSGPGGASAATRYRLAKREDLPACLEVWHDALNGYGPGVGRPPMPRAFGPLELLLAQALETDPERFWLATRETGGGERVIGFASAIVRGNVWFLAMLFVLPGDQARGLGTRLLERVMPDPRAGLVMATCTDAAQPVSNAMYARLGLVPRLPVLQLVGRPDRSPLPPLPAGVRAVPFEVMDGTAWNAAPGSAAPRSAAAGRLADALAGLDRAVLGYERPAEHAFLRRTHRLGHLYEADGRRVLGYGYASASGRLGPIALDDPDLAGPVLGHLIRAMEPAGAYSAWVPGSFDRAVVALLRAGFRLEDFPALLCWNREFGHLDRYVPISLAIL